MPSGIKRAGVKAGTSRLAGTDLARPSSPARGLLGSVRRNLGLNLAGAAVVAALESSPDKSKQGVANAVTTGLAAAAALEDAVDAAEERGRAGAVDEELDAVIVEREREAARDNAARDNVVAPTNSPAVPMSEPELFEAQAQVRIVQDSAMRLSSGDLADLRFRELEAQLATLRQEREREQGRQDMLARQSAMRATERARQQELVRLADRRVKEEEVGRALGVAVPARFDADGTYCSLGGRIVVLLVATHDVGHPGMGEPYRRRVMAIMDANRGVMAMAVGMGAEATEAVVRALLLSLMVVGLEAWVQEEAQRMPTISTVVQLGRNEIDVLLAMLGLYEIVPALSKILARLQEKLASIQQSQMMMQSQQQQIASFFPMLAAARGGQVSQAGPSSRRASEPASGFVRVERTCPSMVAGVCEYEAKTGRKCRYAHPAGVTTRQSTPAKLAR